MQGFSFRPADRLNINLLYSNYSGSYTSLHGNGPAGNSSGTDQYGILGNFTFEAAKFLFISAGSDMRYYPWLRYRCSAPSIAKRHEIRIKYLPSQKLAFEILYDYRLSMADNPDENKIPSQNDIITQSVKWSVRYSPSEYLTLNTRVDYKIVKPLESKGMLLLQDVNLRFRKFPVSFWMRYAIFKTGSFESCLYTWENDLLNSFSIPSLYGTGNRAYIMSSWKISNKAEFRIKYGVTATTVTNLRMKEAKEVKFQLRVIF